MNFKINSIPPIATAVFISPVTMKAMSAVVNVAVIRQLNALARLRVLESGFFSAVMSCMESLRQIFQALLR